MQRAVSPGTPFDETKTCIVQCADGYTVSKDQTKCIKCSFKDCSECSDDGKSCTRCKDGNAFDTKKKICTPCKVANCQTCDKDISKCSKCLYDIRSDTNYGLVNGKCTPCADPHAVLCDNNKVTECQSQYYVDKASNSCRACSPPCVSCESASKCYYCEAGYKPQAVNGVCVSSSNLESEAASGQASTTSAAVTATPIVYATCALILAMVCL